MARRIAAGATLAPRRLESIAQSYVEIGATPGLIHLQFRRFAGCPVCNLHLRSFARRHDALVAAGITEVAVFHSSRELLLSHAAGLPFAVIADPEKRLYAEFGVESGPRALLDPRAWPAIVRAVLYSLKEILAKRSPLPPLEPEGGRLGLPADFLIAEDRRVLACKYGKHADDHWSVDEVLILARQAAR